MLKTNQKQILKQGDTDELKLYIRNEIIDIYEETCEKSDERFQSAHAEAVSLTRKHDTEEKQPCLCRNEINWNNIPSEAVKQYWQRSICFLSLNIAFTDMITLENLQAHPKSCH